MEQLPPLESSAEVAEETGMREHLPSEAGKQQTLQDEVLHEGPQSPLLQPHEQGDSEQSLFKQVREARQRVTTKAEHLRQLKLVRTYRHREETRDLDQVTERWLTACQNGLRDYYQKVKETATEDTNKEDMTFANFIEKLGIDKKLVKYDESNDDFLN